MSEFEDSDKPFHPDDPEGRIPKPKVGDRVIVALTGDEDGQVTGSETGLISGTVLRVHDSLAENWDPEGESAWAMHDLAEAFGYKGRWYVIFDHEDFGLAASFEVKEVIPA